MQEGGLKITIKILDIEDRWFLNNSRSGENVIGKGSKGYLVSEKAWHCPSTPSLKMAAVAGAQLPCWCDFSPSFCSAQYGCQCRWYVMIMKCRKQKECYCGVVPLPRGFINFACRGRSLPIPANKAHILILCDSLLPKKQQWTWFGQCWFSRFFKGNIRRDRRAEGSPR